MENPDSSPKQSLVAPVVESTGNGIPPFSLRHIAIWLACLLIIAGSSILILRTPGLQPNTLEMRHLWVSSAWAAGTAAALTGSLTLGHAWITQKTLVRHPGHCLILIVSATEMLNWIGGWIYITTPNASAWIGSFFSIGMLMLLAYSAWRHCGAWRWIFAISALATLAPFLKPFSIYGSALPHLWSLLAVSVVLVSLGEIAINTKRDWVHWLGVATYASSAAMPLLAALVIQ